MKTRLRQITGRVIHQGAEILVLFRINGKYYPAVEHNCDVMDAYWQTGEEWRLSDLKYEMEA